MRDKVLCGRWTRIEPVSNRYMSFLLKKGSSTLVISFAFLLSEHSVPVSVQGGVKMRGIDEFLNFSGLNVTWRDYKVQKELLERGSRQNLNTIFVAESLLRGTIVDFGGVSSHSGGGNFAKSCFAIN